MKINRWVIAVMGSLLLGSSIYAAPVRNQADRTNKPRIKRAQGGQVINRVKRQDQKKNEVRAVQQKKGVPTFEKRKADLDARAKCLTRREANLNARAQRIAKRERVLNEMAKRLAKQAARQKAFQHSLDRQRVDLRAKANRAKADRAKKLANRQGKTPKNNIRRANRAKADRAKKLANRQGSSPKTHMGRQGKQNKNLEKRENKRSLRQAV